MFRYLNLVFGSIDATQRTSSQIRGWLDDEGVGLSGIRGSPAAYERARLSYTDDVFYEDVQSTSWNSNGGKEEGESKNKGEVWEDDDSGSLTSVD